MISETSLDWLPHSVTYEQYQISWYGKLDVSLAALDKDARKVVFYGRYNWERAERVAAAYEPSEMLAAAMACIEERQIWLVITEDWCVDSAFSLPVIVRAAGLNPLVDLRILSRDQHLEVMDRYLTNGARSIPKLIAFAATGEERFTWGPKPSELQTLRKDLSATGTDAKEIGKAGIEWYDQGGWRLVDAELAQAIREAMGVW